MADKIEGAAVVGISGMAEPHVRNLEEPQSSTPPFSSLFLFVPRSVEILMGRELEPLQKQGP